MEMQDLQDLYVEELRDLYNAEKQLVKALPKMAKTATNEDLKDAFTTHLEETKGHVERLEQIFEKLGKRAGGKTCKAMQADNTKSRVTFYYLVAKDLGKLGSL